MTDQERREAIEEFVEYAERHGVALRERIITEDWRKSYGRISRSDFERLIDRHLLERIPR